VYPTITLLVTHIATASASSALSFPNVICSGSSNACRLVCSLNAPKAKITAIIIEATIIPSFLLGSASSAVFGKVLVLPTTLRLSPTIAIPIALSIVTPP
jgi:hypothetical protein